MTASRSISTCFLSQLGYIMSHIGYLKEEYKFYEIMY